MTTNTTPAAQEWAVIELMGHQRIAGAISQHMLGGQSLVRVDVPELQVTEHVFESGVRRTITRIIPAHSRSLGATSIYGVNWCDEATAIVQAQAIKHEPLRPYNLAAALAALPAGERQRVLHMVSTMRPAHDAPATQRGDGSQAAEPQS